MIGISTEWCFANLVLDEYARRKRMRLANRDRILQQKRDWHHRNKDKISLKQKSYREKHKEKIAERERAWREKMKSIDPVAYAQKKRDEYLRNIETYRKYQAEVRARRTPRKTLLKELGFSGRFLDLTKEQQSVYKKAWNARASDEQRQKRRAWARSYSNKRYATDPNYKVASRLRSRLYEMTKKQGNQRSHSLGLSREEVVAHLERKFLPGMTWENHGEGAGKWHIDHIIPCSKFDLSKKEDVKKCFSLFNLQPMWSTENIKKSNKVPTQEHFCLEFSEAAQMPGSVNQ